MDYKDYFAVAGFALSLISITINIYKDFFRKGKIEIMDDFLILNVRDITRFVFQINLRILAKRSNIHIKEIYLINIRGFTGNDEKTLKLNRAIPYGAIDPLSHDVNKFSQDIKSRFAENIILLSDLKIEKGSIKSLTFADSIKGNRLPDGWEDTPKDCWAIRIHYDKEEITKKLDVRFF